MNQENTNVLDSDRIGPLLFKLALPAFIGTAVVTLYNIVNTIFIGQYVGYLGIAGLSLVFPLQMLGVGFGVMLGIGGGSLISRLMGEQKKARAERVLGNAFTLNIMISLIMTALVLANPDFWLRLIGASDEVLPYARDYIVIIFAGIIFNNFAMAANGLTIAQGNTRITMIAQIMGAIINVILDSIFIIGLGMGVKGAAIGTVLAQLATTIFFLIFYLKGRGYLKVNLRNLIPEFKIIGEIMAIGITPLATTISGSAAGMIANILLVSFGDDVALSASGILSRFLIFIIMPSMVIGQGLQPIIGYNYGAKRYDRILKGIKIAVIAATGISLAGFLVVYFYPVPFIRIFTGDNDLITLTSYALKRAFLGMYLAGFVIIASMVFVAMGKATQSFIISIFRNAGFLIPVMFIFGHNWKLDGVWLTYPVVDVLSTGLVLALFIPAIKDLRKKRDKENASVSHEWNIATELAQRK